MAQKVFILESFIASDMDANSVLISNYWGSNNASIKFIAHASYLYRLADSTGYLALKVKKIKKPDHLDGRWVAFDITKLAKINQGKSKAKFFVIKKEVLDVILSLDPNSNAIGGEIGVEIIGIKRVFSLIIGSATFNYVGGIGTGSPSAGAKVP